MTRVNLSYLNNKVPILTWLTTNFVVFDCDKKSFDILCESSAGRPRALIFDM